MSTLLHLTGVSVLVLSILAVAGRGVIAAIRRRWREGAEQAALVVLLAGGLRVLLAGWPGLLFSNWFGGGQAG